VEVTLPGTAVMLRVCDDGSGFAPLRELIRPYLTRVTRSLTRKNFSPPAWRKIPSFFTKNFSLCEKFLVKKIKKYHAAAGESDVHLVKHPV
jgi:hypothetical protein